MVRLKYLVVQLVASLCLHHKVAATECAAKRNGLAFASPAHPTPIPPPPPISMPVWSLACPVRSAQSPQGGSRKDEPREVPLHAPPVSMNIVTFATPVSVAQPKLWAVSLYYNTLTKDSFFEHERGVLQLLAPKQKTLVPTLGKRSGYEAGGFSKQDECSSLGFPWHSPPSAMASPSDAPQKQSLLESMCLLPECAFYIELELVSSMDAGDHVLALCKVVQTGEWDEVSRSVNVLEETPKLSLDTSNALYTALLRQEGII